MDEKLLSRPSKPLSSKTITFYIRVPTRELERTYIGRVARRHLFTLDHKEIEEFPEDVEHIYIKRLTVEGCPNPFSNAKRSYNYLYASTKPTQVSHSEVTSILTNLDFLGVEYDTTLAVNQLVGYRTYEDGKAAAEIMKHLVVRGSSSVLPWILESESPFLLIVNKSKSALPAGDRKLVLKSVNGVSFFAGEEEELIRLKLAHGGKLIDMWELTKAEARHLGDNETNTRTGR